MGSRTLFLKKILPGLLALILNSSSAASFVLAADDIIILKNGDRITGEIKKLVNGDLHVDPSYGENIFIIDWAEVERVEGKNQFITQTSDEEYLTGSIQTHPDQSGQLIVENGVDTAQFEQSELVFLKPVDEGFWGRLSTSIDFGMSFTKANETRQLNARATAGYLTERWSTSASFDTLLNSRSDVAEQTRRTEFGGDYRYTFSGQ